MKAWTVEISLDLDSEMSNLSFEKEFVALTIAAVARGRVSGAIGKPRIFKEVNIPNIQGASLSLKKKKRK